MDELGKQGVLFNADGKEAYDPEDGGGDTDPEEEGMECESLLDSEETPGSPQRVRRRKCNHLAVWMGKPIKGPPTSLR